MIQPALNPEEWAEKKFMRQDRESGYIDEDGDLILHDGDGGYASAFLYSQHQIAALALHGQPFGFSWEDVEILDEASHPFNYGLNAASREQLAALRDRIAALLPPRTP